jgi:hypothetical protein
VEWDGADSDSLLFVILVIEWARDGRPGSSVKWRMGKFDRRGGIEGGGENEVRILI